MYTLGIKTTKKAEGDSEMNEDRCVCCGAYIPEGTMICHCCEIKTRNGEQIESKRDSENVKRRDSETTKPYTRGTNPFERFRRLVKTEL